MLEQVVHAVKRKKELESLDDSVVLKKVKGALRREPKIAKKLEKAKKFSEFSRSGEFKELKRLVREELRKVFGVFDKDEKREKRTLLSSIDADPQDRAAIQRLLALHQSSKERLPHYAEIYRRIFAITGEPKIILDLGCGFNPYSYDDLGCAPFYIAVDLPNSDLEQIGRFFKRKGLHGYTFGLDLTAEHEKLRSMHRVDVAFLFKLLDSLETVTRHVSTGLLDDVNARWLIVSFPTVSIGGKKRIASERRAWFEKILARKRWKHERFELGGEIFYVIRKGAR